jgi:hypothetical protein
MVSMTDEKECFFIAPIGDDGSEIRERTDKLMEYIVDEAVSDYDYSVTRADQMDQPGSITNQIIEKTVNSELVIADLTGHNPNVFYELAVRHATGEPCLQLIKSSDSIPFDISDLRTIQYGLGVEEADRAREQIRSQLEALRDEEVEFDNPISRSAEMESLRESADPTDQNLAEVLQTVSRLDRKIDQLGRRIPAKSSSKSVPTSSETKDPSQAIQFTIGDTHYSVEDGYLTEAAIKSITENSNKSAEEIREILEKQNIELRES